MADPQKNPTEARSAQVVMPAANVHGKRSKMLLAAVVVVILLLVGGIWYRSAHKNNGSGQAVACNDTFITSNANPVFQQTALQPYSALSQAVQAKPGYAKDPNCLYILTTTYVMIGDSAKAAATLAQLKTVYKPQVGFSKVFTPKADLGELKGLVEAAQHTTNGVQSTVESQI